MKLRSVLLSFLLLITRALFGQKTYQSSTMSATGLLSAIKLNEITAGYKTITWVTAGSPTGCTIALTGSATRGGSYTTLGAAQTCTSSGSYTVVGSAVNFVKVNLSALSGGTAPTVTVYVSYSPASYSAQNDGTFFVPASQCGGGISGTAGTGNATDIVGLSGGLRVFRLANTNAGASTNTFTCHFTVPSRLTTGKGATITDITFLVSTQTTQPTSIGTITLKSLTPPAAADPETANSATFVTAGGTLTTTPTSLQFAAYSPVSAGQFFSVKVGLATPIAVNTDLQLFQLVVPFGQTASAAAVQEVPGFIVHYNTNPL